MRGLLTSAASKVVHEYGLSALTLSNAYQNSSMSGL
jgi:hypothetical protein